MGESPGKRDTSLGRRAAADQVAQSDSDPPDRIRYPRFNFDWLYITAL
jgi:hypothetical protein